MQSRQTGAYVHEAKPSTAFNILYLCTELNVFVKKALQVHSLVGDGEHSIWPHELQLQLLLSLQGQAGIEKGEQTCLASPCCMLPWQPGERECASHSDGSDSYTLLQSCEVSSKKRRTGHIEEGILAFRRSKLVKVVKEARSN